jgi:ribonucleotide reductase alpha subunit
VDDVGAAFLLAHELGCKGSTVFRDGTGREQFLVRGSDTSQEACEVCT